MENNESQDYFFSDLDFHLQRGCKPSEALLLAVKDYACVYFGIVEENKSDWPKLLKGL